MTRDVRRLAAIVSADVVGYSLLMGRDDSATLEGLKAHRRELIDPKIAEYGGRIVKTTGDGLLLEFPSVVDAVRCAVDVQRGMAERNAGVPPEKLIDLRIGINVGDIIIDGDDIFGDGVNVAARLQTLAEPGGICVSRVVRDQVLDKLSFTFEDLGPQEVKNIARPVEVYRVELGIAAPQGLGRGLRRWQRSTRALGRRWFAAGVVALSVVVGAAWLLPQLWKPPPLLAPPAMSVGVMPLVASAGDAALAQRAESLTHDLISMLTRASPMIRATPAPSSLTTAERGGGSVARMLNVRYLLEGELRPGGDMAIVSLRLINGTTSEQIWSETVSLKDADMLRGQMRALRTAVGHLYRSLSDTEIRRVTAERGDVTALDYVLRAVGLSRTEPETLHRVHEEQRLYEEALRRDPNLVPALNGLAIALDVQLARDSHADRDRLVRRMDELTSRSVNLDVGGPLTWAIRAVVLMRKGQWDASIEAGALSIRLDPDSSLWISNQAWLLTLSGRPDQALALVDEATALSFPELRTACHAHLLLGQYKQAIAACERAKGLSVGDWAMDLWLAAAYAHDGDTAKAAVAKADVLREIPDLTIAGIKAKGFSVNPDYLRQAEEHWYSGLRKAGLPER